MKLEDYKTILYRQEDGSFVAEIPVIPGVLRAHADSRSGSIGTLERL